jgi:DNA-binding FadR family transcriptional regulator
LLDVARDHQEIVAAIKTGDRTKAIPRHSAHFPRIQRLLNIPV